VRVLLVRHARAGEREEWEGDDRLRPLDERGQRQAALLARILRDEGATQLLSSPYVRCTQTFEPAAAQGLPLELREELAEGGVRDDILDLLRSLSPEGVPALCTHGDVIAELIGSERKAAKGSVWELEVEAADGRISPLRYLPPPA
jgi:phosphohistidine phosphatase SixA